MKKLLAAMLSAGMVMGLAGCAGQPSNTGSKRVLCLQYSG